MMNYDEKIKEIKKRVNGITWGMWSFDAQNRLIVCQEGWVPLLPDNKQADRDKEFILNASDDILHLLNYVEKLQAENARLVDALFKGKNNA